MKERFVASVEKRKREVNEENLQRIRELPCSVCNQGPPSDPCHIRGRGAGGPDELWNLYPGCRSCHQKQHKIGLVTFFRKNAKFRAHLEEKGWHEDYRGKLVRDMD